MLLVWSILLCALALAPWLPWNTRDIGHAAVIVWVLAWVGQGFALLLAILAVLSMAFAIASGSTVWTTGLLFAAAVLFLAVHGRSHRSGQALQSAVADWAGESAPADTMKLSFFTGLWPLKFRQSGVEKLTDIVYQSGGERGQLDIYRPTNIAAGNAPVLLQIHGGAWVSGRKETQAQPLMNHLASRGWVCVAINYRLAPNHRFPTMANDVFAAIRWVKTHIAEYGGDPSFIALTGGSAGGHLALTAGLLGSQAASILDSDGCRVNALVPLYARYDFLERAGGNGGFIKFLTRYVMPSPPEQDPDLWAAASPLDQIQDAAPPTLVMHGSHDSLIEIDEARYFVERFISADTGDRRLFVEISGAQHAFDILNTPVTRHLVVAIEQFLNVIRATTDRV